MKKELDKIIAEKMSKLVAVNYITMGCQYIALGMAAFEIKDSEKKALIKAVNELIDACSIIAKRIE